MKRDLGRERERPALAVDEVRRRVLDRTAAHRHHDGDAGDERGNHTS